MRSFDGCVITTIHPPFEARIWARGVLPLLESGLSICLISGWRLIGDPTGTGRFSSVWVRPPQNRRDRILHSVRIFLRAARCRARVYHFHDLDFLPFALFLRIVKHARVIYDCHENHHLQVRNDKVWIPRGLRGALSVAVDHFERWSVRMLGACIVPLPEMEERFRHRGVRVVTVQNRTAWAPARDLSHGPDIVYSGTIGANYGLHVLLGIGRELKARRLDRRLFITLRNALSQDEKMLRESITREGLPIVVHESVTADRIGVLLCLGTIGLSLEQDTPEKQRAVPAKLFEYMAFGLPVISSDVRSNRAIIERAGCGVTVPAAEPAKFVDAIERLLADPDRLRQMRENGFRAVETMYSWKVERERLIALYRLLLGRDSLGRGS